MLGIVERDRDADRFCRVVMHRDPHSRIVELNDAFDHHLPALTAQIHLLLEPFHLRTQDGGGELRHSRIHPNKRRLIKIELLGPLVAPDIVVHTSAGVVLRTVRDQCPALTATNVLVLVEAKDANVAHRPGGLPPIGHADCLAGILNDEQIVLIGDCDDCVHVSNQVQHVDRNNGLCCTGHSGLDVDRVDGQALVDIDKNWNRTNRDHGSGRRDPGVCGYEHLVARTNLCANEGTNQRRRPAVERQRMC